MRQPMATANELLNGQPDRRLPVFVCICLALMSAVPLSGAVFALDTSSLKELAQLARAGAPQRRPDPVGDHKSLAQAGVESGAETSVQRHVDEQGCQPQRNDQQQPEQ